MLHLVQTNKNSHSLVHDILNPEHIVNVMYGSTGQQAHPTITIEMIDRTVTVGFENHFQAMQLIKLIGAGAVGRAITVSSVNYEPSRWAKG